MTRRQPGTQGLGSSARRIGALAWPAFIGQLAVLAFATIDTVLVARHAAADLAALAVGAAAYTTTFVGFMGVVLAVGPVAGRLFGAGCLPQAGQQFHQALWVALGLSVLGSALLAFPAPFLSLSQVAPDVADKVRGYLLALAFSLPASLLFAAFRGFNTAVSRPKAVMAIQMGGLALKVPLSLALISGVPALGVPGCGVVGCGIATCVAMWAQTLAAAWLLHRDAFYVPFRITGRGLDAPDRASLSAQLRLGVPMGAAILVEVSGFTFMSLFIARLGTTPVAGHQIAVNVVSLLFMMPLAIANGCSTLVAQRIGAGDPRDARRLGWHGMLLGSGVAALMGGALFAARGPVIGLYTADLAVAAAALSLLALVPVFHLADAVQTIAAFVLRAYHIATVPLIVNAAALWGVGLGGGYVLAFGLGDLGTRLPAFLQGAPGFWSAATLGLVLTAMALGGYLARVLHAQRATSPAAPA